MAGWLAIVNPAAGALRNDARRRAWLARLASATAAVAFTDGPGDATRLARSAAGFDGIVAVGGDGTVQQVLAGIDRSRQQLAVIPAGRGNNLAQALGVGGFVPALAALAQSPVRQVDLMAVDVGLLDGSTTRTLAASVVAVGYAAAVARRAALFARCRGHAYSLAAAVTLPAPMDIRLGYGSAMPVARRLSGVVVGNTRHLAKFPAFPNASVTDGRLDIMELDAGWTRQGLHNLSLLSSIPFHRPAPVDAVPAVRWQLPTPATLLLDGELIENVAEVRVQCLPAAVACRGWA